MEPNDKMQNHNRRWTINLAPVAAAIGALLATGSLNAQETPRPAPATQGSAVPGAPATPAAPAAAAKPGGFKNLTVEEFAQMSTNQATVILDVRTAKEFEAGHLAKAVNLDVLAADFEQKVASLDKTQTYLVHCAAGGRSVTACKALGQIGFPKLYNLSGGFKAWVKAGKPVEK